ncbi:MAG TPA: glycosyltransferase [Anaerolineae bacterium]|nr:glycosyltransferase [Anaerolineae bacterium]
MNILHVTLGFYPATAWGGPVKIVHRNGRELVRRGHRVTVYCTNLLDKKQKINPGTSEACTFERWVDGMRVVYFNTWRLPWWPGTLGPVWLPDLPVYLRNEIGSYDIVHVNSYRNLMNLPVVRAVRQAEVPLVVQPHGAMPVIINSFLVKRVYDRLLGGVELGGLDALIALQESERQQAMGRGVPEERITIIPNGLDLSELTEIPETGTFRRRYNVPADRSLILFLGRINKKKGTDMLVEAFRRVNGLDAYLAIVGPDDGQLEEVRRLIVRYRLEDSVLLTGLLPGAEAMAAYRDADLFVLPCRADTFPTTIMEACLTGTPMVITDRCEIAHLVKDRVADVVPFDPSAFAEAMRRLLTDRERYRTYRENCPRVMAQEFSLRAVVDRLEGLYQTVIARKNCGGG